MTEMTRKEKMAQEKAAWEAAQAAKKAAKQEARATKTAKKEKSLVNDEPLENQGATAPELNAGVSEVSFESAPTPPTGRRSPKAPKPPKPPKAPKAPKPPKASKSDKTADTQDALGPRADLSTVPPMPKSRPVVQSAISPLEDPLVDAGLLVDLTSNMRDTKQARRVRTRNAKSSSKAAGAKSNKKKSVTYKTALRMGLSEPVASMIEEKNRILRLWKSRKITPELAVSNLSVLQARDPDGSVWRLLPRYGGYALVRTGHDGVPSIVEPPRKRRAWPAVVGGVLFSVLIVLALWGVVNPATDGEERIEAPSTVVSE
jgi:hypothetical protein